MKSIQVVTESHPIHDDKTTLQLIEEKDVNELIRKALKPIQGKQSSYEDELQKQDGTVKRIDRIEEETKHLKAKQSELEKKQQNLEKRFDDFLKKLNAEIAQCCENGLTPFLRPFLEQLGKITADLKQEIAENRKSQDIIREQLELSTALADYFCTKFKNDFALQQQIFQKDEEQITQLNSALAKIHSSEH